MRTRLPEQSDDLPSFNLSPVEFELPVNTCTACGHRASCLAAERFGANAPLADIARCNRQRQPGQAIYRQRDACRSLFVIKSGSVKLTHVAENGSESVLGFYFAPSVIGIDGIGYNSHTSTAIALESTLVCEVPVGDACELGRARPDLQHRLFSLLSQQLINEQQLALVLNAGSARQRMAALLLLFSEQGARRHLSAARIPLPMSRRDIADYLGLTVETVSRVLSDLVRREIITLAQREISVLNFDSLHETASGMHL